MRGGREARHVDADLGHDHVRDGHRLTPGIVVRAGAPLPEKGARASPDRRLDLAHGASERIDLVEVQA